MHRSSTPSICHSDNSNSTENFNVVPAIRVSSEVSFHAKYNSLSSSDHSIHILNTHDDKCIQAVPDKTDCSNQQCVAMRSEYVDASVLVPKCISRTIEHIYILNIMPTKSTKSESTQCGQIHLKRNKVKIIKDSKDKDESVSITKEELDEAVYDYKNSPKPEEETNNNFEGKSQIEPFENEDISKELETKSSKAHCKPHFPNYDFAPKETVPQSNPVSNYEPIPILPQSNNMSLKKFKPMGIYGQTEELGRFPIIEVKNQANKRTLRKHSFGSMGASRAQGKQPMISNYSDAATPFLNQPSSYFGSNKDSFAHSFLDMKKYSSQKKKSPTKTRILRRRNYSIKQDASIIDWSNSILYYNIKNGVTGFNVEKDEVFHEFEIQYIIDSINNPSDAMQFKEKITNTVNKLCKEMCISVQDEHPIDMLNTTKTMFAARAELVEFLSNLSKREILIMKDIMYMINSEYIEDRQLLLDKVSELRRIDTLIMTKMGEIQSKYSFMKSSFMLNGIEIKLIISVEWKEITAIMRDVHKIPIE